MVSTAERVLSSVSVYSIDRTISSNQLQPSNPRIRRDQFVYWLKTKVRRDSEGQLILHIKDQCFKKPRDVFDYYAYSQPAKIGLSAFNKLWKACFKEIKLK
jgi:hypothetical protein